MRLYKLGSILILFALLFPCSVVAANEAKATPDAHVVSIAHVALRVANLEASRAFYRRLGYVEAFAFSKDGVTTQSFFKINDRQFLELYPAKGTEAPALLHLCYESDDLPALWDRLRQKDVPATSVRKAGAGNLLSTWHDPADRLIELTQYMPGSRHTEDKGKDLGDNRVSLHLLGAAVAVSSPEEMEQYYEAKLDFGAGRQQWGDLIVPLPSPSDEFLAFSPEDKKPTLFFASQDLKQTRKLLQSIGVKYEDVDHHLKISDPDGNRIVFLGGQ